MFESALVKAQNLNAKVVRMWSDGIEAAKLGASEIMNIAATFDSDGPETIYIMGEELRTLRTRPEGSDELIPDVINAFEATVKNERKYRMFDIPLTDLSDDKIGKYLLRARQLGRAAVTGPILDMETLIQNADAAGSAAFTADKVAFFSASHPTAAAQSGSATWSNKLVKAAGLTFDTFAETLAAMRKFPSADGKAVGSKPTHILVPADYEGIANDIAKLRLPSGLAGAENKWLGLKLEVVVVSNWTRDMWMLADASDSVERPFIFQEREPVQIVPVYVNPEGGWEIEHDGMRWMVKGRYGIGYGYPNKAVMVVKS